MYKIMSNHYTYGENNYEGRLPLNATILVEKNVIWHGGTDPIEEPDFPNNTNTTLGDNVNETYMTADGDNTTQYFSVLESTADTILNDISNVSINNTDIQEENDTLEQQFEENNSCIDISGQQVVLFKIDDSDDLYGVQVGQDEAGDVQKYQFKVRQNEEGNLEAIPESIQILPLDTDIITTEASNEIEEELQNDENCNPPVAVFVKQEQHAENPLTEVACRENFDEQDEIPYDTKEGILDVTATITQKQEIFDPESGSETDEYIDTHDQSYFQQPSENINDLHMGDEEDEEEDDQSNFYISENQQGQSGEEPECDDQGHYEELFVKESHLILQDSVQRESSEDIHIEPNFHNEQDGHESRDSSEYEAQENLNENESDNDDYEVVDGVHVTGDVEDLEGENEEDVSREDEFAIRKSLNFERHVSKYRTHKIIKNVIRKVKIKGPGSENKCSTYFLIRDPEKENVEISSNTFIPKPNPRSILKCSLAPSEEHKKYPDDEKYEKRFAKSKEAQQARSFHNFIAQTKIIHAPVRHERQPRKQKIEPMERTDEEIVVQEVVVSSNGFIETTEDGILKERTPLKPTEYIQLSDSDEDYDPKGKQKRKRKHKKRRSQEVTTISDSEEDDSDDSVIEINASDESEGTTALSPPKRPRGRPPKHPTPLDNSTGDNNCTENGQAVTKRPRGRPPKLLKNRDKSTSDEGKDDFIETIIIKTDYRCPKCPKTFPSEGGLSTHMQYHNFNNEPDVNVKEKKAAIDRKSTCFTNKYMCDICGDSFKNNFLLMRHINSHKDNKFSCKICKKNCDDNSELVRHNRVHIKNHMFKTTTVPKVSPKKMLVQTVKKPPKRQEHKCSDCNKVFSTHLLLSTHEKLHKRFTCHSCKKFFNSKFMLENHVRENCVKVPNRRLGINTRKSFINPPVQIIRPEMQSVKPNQTVTNIKCDSCSMTFATYTSLFKHKVVKHGLETADTTIGSARVSQSLYKPQSKHSGVPTGTRLQTAFMGLKSKLENF